MPEFAINPALPAPTAPRPSSAALVAAPAADTSPEDPLRAAAVALETSFLTEMLKHSGVGKPLESFGGGPGEDAFSSFLVEAYAEKITNTGGLGLADKIYSSLRKSHGL